MLTALQGRENMTTGTVALVKQLFFFVLYCTFIYAFCKCRLLKKMGIHLNLWVETNENDTGSSAPRPPRDFLKALASPRHYA